jgi:branched-chain amino acid transport system permease protein
MWRFSAYSWSARAACFRAPAIEASMDVGADVSAAPSPAPRFAVRTTTRLSSLGAMAAVGLVAALVVLPAFADRRLVQDLFFVLTMLVLAQSWNLLAGYAGLLSVGQQAFVGLGGYALFGLTIMAGVDPALAVVLSGLIAGVVAVPTAFIVFRLQGPYFAIGTWVVAETIRLVLAQVKQLGGGTGTSLPPAVTSTMVGLDAVRRLFDLRGSAARDVLAYWMALTLAVLTMGAIYTLLRSRRGLALAAIRDSELAAESCGVNAFRTKFFVYLMTAILTGSAGALIYLQKARISPDAAFSLLDWTADVIVIVVIGGIGTLEGPILGVLMFYALQTYFAATGTWYLMLLGGLAIAMMLFAPRGLWGLLSERFDVQVFALRRTLLTSAGPDQDAGAETDEKQ